MFYKGSRYNGVDTAEHTNEQGQVVRYKKVRFIPLAKGLRTHTVTHGERLDHIAHRYYRDPERFWRICDANLAPWPGDLTKDAGKRIQIPSSEK